MAHRDLSRKLQNVPYDPDDGAADQPLHAVEWWLPFIIPRYFETPSLPSVNPSAVTTLDSSYEDLSDIEAIRKRLAEESVQFVNGSRSFDPKNHSVDLTGGRVTLRDLPQIPKPFARPDHAFILEGGGFVPFHAVPFAAYCANVAFPPQPSTDATQALPSSSYHVNLVPLRFNNIKALVWFREWIYHQDDNILRKLMIPSERNVPRTPIEQLNGSPKARFDLAQAIASAYTELEQWNSIFMVLDLRDLMILLGVDDLRVYGAMEVAWDVVLQSLNACCVKHAQADAAKGIDTSQAREWLNRGLGFFEDGAAWKTMDGSRVRSAQAGRNNDATTTKKE
ncbi:hypothetical protein FRC03_008745 [Tulasnella sp. 419]|nr:hypothetical protein FRC03_008745 [Tulasnella sp. 419]